MRAILVVVFVSLLTACGINDALPNTPLVKRAIALQVAQTQQELSQQLRLDLPESAKVEVDRVSIATQEPFVINNLQAYRVQGTYDFTLKLPKRQLTQKNNPFEVYLQRQSEGKTWRLAQRQKSENGVSWITQRVE